MAFATTSLIFACADDQQTEAGADEVGDGDGDGEPEGDGDGEPAGDGDGEPAGDGDGEAPGDGDGEVPGDGDGDAQAEECKANADMIAPEIAQPDGGCTIIVRFDYQSLEPKAWSSDCADFSDTTLDIDEARKLSDCCSDGEPLNPDDTEMFILYKTPAPEGGVAVVSNHLAKRSFEATMLSMGEGEITEPQKWVEPDNLGSGCGATVPTGTGYDLTMEGAELDAMALDSVLSAFADTALTQAIEQNAKIRKTLTLAYPLGIDPVDPEKAEYVLIVETGK